MQELAGDIGRLPLEIAEDGAVTMGGEPLGTLTGFHFDPDPEARAGERKKLISAAERRLQVERARRAASLAAAPDEAFTLDLPAECPPAIHWNGAPVARLAKGASPLAPALTLAPAIRQLDQPAAAAIETRLSRWLTARIEALLKPLTTIAETVTESTATPAARGLALQLIEALGVLPRRAVQPLLATMAPPDHRLLGKAGVKIGALSLFVPALLKPAPTQLRLALWAAASETERVPAPPAPGLVSVETDPATPPNAYRVSGFGLFGGRAVRLDMVERLAADLAKSRKGKKPVVPPMDWRYRLGVDEESFVAIMKALGYRRIEAGAVPAFSWRGQAAPPRTPRKKRAPPKPANPNSPFAALAKLGLTE